jgi:hypothetical protein
VQTVTAKGLALNVYDEETVCDCPSSYFPLTTMPLLTNLTHITLFERRLGNHAQYPRFLGNMTRLVDLTIDGAASRLPLPDEWGTGPLVHSLKALRMLGELDWCGAIPLSWCNFKLEIFDVTGFKAYSSRLDLSSTCLGAWGPSLKVL